MDISDLIARFFGLKLLNAKLEPVSDFHYENSFNNDKFEITDSAKLLNDSMVNM